MTCDRIMEGFTDYLLGETDSRTADVIRDHLAGCPSCREELESLSTLWTRLGVLEPEHPSGRLRENFYAMLEAEIGKKSPAALREEQPSFFNSLRKFMTFRHPAFAAGFSFLLVIGSLYVGFNIGGGSRTEVRSLRNEIQDARKTAALSLLDRPSTADRLEGINCSSQLENPDATTLKALFERLNGDSSPNVRLAAIDALYLFRDRPGIKEGLIRSLEKQTLPIVQVALIDLLVDIRERRAADALKKLIQTQKINPEVKKRAEMGLKKIV